MIVLVGSPVLPTVKVLVADGLAIELDLILIKSMYLIKLKSYSNIYVQIKIWYIYGMIRIVPDGVHN